ncbi:MAG: c-type cytochrome [Flavobacteriales bacterium]
MTDTFSILSKVHMVLVLLFVISMFIKTILIFKSNESFDNYRAKTKMPEMLVTILFLIIGIVLIVMKDGPFHTLFYVKLGAVVAGIPLGIIGAKKHSKILIALSTIFFFGAYALSEIAKGKGVQKEISQEVKVENLGKEIYTTNCSSCHGADGKQGSNGASDLSATTLNTEEISKVINEGRRGKGVMPKFTYEGEQLKALTNYLDSLKTK